MEPQGTNPRHHTIAVIGAGVAGLITAYTLLQDGFTDVQVLTREEDVGGVWERGRIYPGLYLNNVHGEYRLSPLDMLPPATAGAADSRLTGDDLSRYMHIFASRFLEGHIKHRTEVRHIRPSQSGTGWEVVVYDMVASQEEIRHYAKVVLCTGGCNSPLMPDNLSPKAAQAAGYKGMVFHSMDFVGKMDDLLPPASPTDHDSQPVVVIGGGKSAQDICAAIANKGCKVTIVCPNMDAFTAGPKPLPDFIRKSRLLSLFSPHIHLRTYLERLMHTTWIGKKIVDFVWHGLVNSSFQAVGVPEYSPLRNTVSPFWHIRVNDEGVPRPNGFHALVIAGKIDVICPGRVAGYSENGVVLEDGRSIDASAVILATGYTSSWPTMFDKDTMEDLSLTPRPIKTATQQYEWKYTTLSNPPPLHPDAKRWASTMYRGIVPYKHIAKRDFAVNGAVVSPNFGYTTEVTAHWISSFFLADEMRLPATPEEALAATERDAAWLRARYPQIPTALNGSHTSYLAFWSWLQHVDDLLEDMGLPAMRSGGNWLTWPFKVIDMSEIQHLKEERDAKRALAKSTASAN